MTDAAQAAIPSSSAFRVFQAQPLPGLVFAIRFRPDGTSEELKIDQPVVEGGDDWLWLHFNLSDARSAALLKSRPDLPEQARALLVAAEEHQQLEADDHCVYGIFSARVQSRRGHRGHRLHAFCHDRKPVSHQPQASPERGRGNSQSPTHGSQNRLNDRAAQSDRPAAGHAVTQHAENLAAHMESGLPPTTLASCGERSAMCAAPPFACTASS